MERGIPMRFYVDRAHVIKQTFSYWSDDIGPHGSSVITCLGPVYFSRLVRFHKSQQCIQLHETILKPRLINNRKPVFVYNIFLRSIASFSLCRFSSNCTFGWKQKFLIFSWMDSCKMKRIVCTPLLAFRSVGIILAIGGAFLAIFWPQLFEHLLAKVGFITLNKNFYDSKLFIDRNLRLAPSQKHLNNGRNRVCRST